MVAELNSWDRRDLPGQQFLMELTKELVCESRANLAGVTQPFLIVVIANEQLSCVRSSATLGVYVQLKGGAGLVILCSDIYDKQI